MPHPAMMYTLRPATGAAPMTTDQPDRNGIIETPDRRTRATFVRVIVIEIAVLLTLWAFSTMFSS